MENKSIFTGTYLLQKSGDTKSFGYIQGFAYLPNYETKVKIFINNNRFDTSDIDGFQIFMVDRDELECISKGTQFVENSLGNLISLAKRDLLKNEAYCDMNLD